MADRNILKQDKEVLDRGNIIAIIDFKSWDHLIEWIRRVAAISGARIYVRLLEGNQNSAEVLHLGDHESHQEALRVMKSLERHLQGEIDFQPVPLCGMH